MNYVIVGNSTSAIAAIKAIRETERKGKITVISAEPYLNYSRPLISYLLGKHITADKMEFCGKDFYKENQVKLLLGKKAVKLDVRKKQVILSNRQKVGFDRLLITTGGKAIIPPIKGLNIGGIFTFVNLDDARAIEKYIRANKVKQALVLGAGLIGLKATEALIELGIKVTIVELADRILSATFDRKASRMIEQALEKIGCRLLTNNSITEIKGEDSKVNQVILKDNKRLPTDLVILAVGVRPNIELVKDTAIKTDRGILVDSFMQTNLKDIYAAGDCAQGEDMLSGTNRNIAIWPVAARQGQIAGYNMARQTGIKKEYTGSFAMNAVELCGIPTISVGQTNPTDKDCEILEYYQRTKSVYKKIVLKDNRIIGAIFVGDIERAGIYTGLIKDKIDISGFKEHLLKDDFGLVSLPKELRKHLVAAEAAII